MVEATLGDLAIATVLRGNLTQSDGDVVLSTTLLEDWRARQAREQRLEWKSLGVIERSSKPPRRTVREWR